ncbi:MAG TPA: molybdate ABC transporter substrate-binding protein [Spirochaetia bacterium]|nr:molybdate ABC transporter substrate-binding protein [Spirochaetia bacterium]
MKLLTLLVLLAVAAAPGLPAEQPVILVSAAASLTDVLGSLKDPAEAYIGAGIQFNFGASGTLRKQIEEGAPVDLFFSAAREDMDRLQKEGMIAPATRRDLLSNQMALIASEPGPPVTDASGLRPLMEKAALVAIGNPDLVPAGRYAREALRSSGLLPAVEGKLVLGGNVREVLQYVESGSAPFGIVFATEARSVKKGSPVKVIWLFPPEAVATPILYPAAVVSTSKHPEAAAKMIEFLQGRAAREAFRAAGFIVK